MTAPIRSYRDLIVWQKAMALRRLVYEVVRDLPPEERFALGVQLRRSAVSVAANIAEGHARQHRRDYRQYLSMSRGSVAELETELIAAHDEKYVDDATFGRAMALADEISRMVATLISRLSDGKEGPTG